ncbi:hypothetical protein [Leptospira vanthielii]|uniref:Tetratricopeptide repeat protein n=1 Tax=Leptospira vanthielii serovar Holland str. Waz Holland = ATCC 700522 TaxID=1218591 RepID=N1W8B6_9LEPT|nr:hypothetical protein [Leptospira vanthielii]EMY68096.1 hypothetical protein LEP1GSC199_0020 [Leptospira vanthielii serovar Holland str. Waz Holland = ATCC 700522]
MKKISLIFLLFTTSVIFADSVSEEDTFLYRYHLREKKFSEAEDLLSKFQNSKIDQTKLELLETELWIAKGEDLYSRKQFKSAFHFYNDAYVRWRTNPLIKDRYTELSGKVLHDEEIVKLPIKPKTNRQPDEKEKEFIYLTSNADIYFLMNHFRLEELEKKANIIYGIGGAIFAILLIQVIINLILLIRK